MPSCSISSGSGQRNDPTTFNGEPMKAERPGLYSPSLSLSSRTAGGIVKVRSLLEFSYIYQKIKIN